MEHPALAYSQVLKALKWHDGRVYEDHQNTPLYIIPAPVFQNIRLELREVVGKRVAESILYPFNQLSADTIIRDGKGFGFHDMELVRYFLAIMALFGWGFASEFEFDPESKRGTIIIQDFPTSGSCQDEPVHDDFRGILARALQLAFGGEYTLTELSCCEIEGSHETCVYDIRPVERDQAALSSKMELVRVPPVDAKNFPKNTQFRDFRRQLKMPKNGVLELENETGSLRVVIKDLASINSMILKTIDLIGEKTVGGAIFRVGRSAILRQFQTIPKLDLSTIRKYLAELSLFGWGLFEILEMGDGTTEIVLQNSPFVHGFPRVEYSADFLIRGVLMGLFEKTTDRRAQVTEIECEARGDSQCRFRIEMK